MEKLYRNLTVNFADLEEKFVKSVVLYGHTDNFLYLDKAHKTKVSKAVALQLLQGTVIIEAADASYYPVRFKVGSGGNIEVVVKDDASTEKTYKSDAK